MKKYIAIATFLLTTALSGVAQSKYFTRTGSLGFYSETPVENIEAVNNQASAILDLTSGEIAVSAQMIGFEFEKALMQEHFNENYVESDKYPKATFKGRIANAEILSALDNTDRECQIEGDLTVHGVTKPIKTTGYLHREGESIAARTVFTVAVADHGIKIPKAVINNIAETVEVRVQLSLEPYQK